jgi:hypothetical protein
MPIFGPQVAPDVNGRTENLTEGVGVGAFSVKLDEFDEAAVSLFGGRVDRPCPLIASPTMHHPHCWINVHLEGLICIEWITNQQLLTTFPFFVIEVSRYPCPDLDFWESLAMAALKSI